MRDILGIQKRRADSAETLERLRARMATLNEAQPQVNRALEPQD
jgi:hypothetical protein